MSNCCEFVGETNVKTMSISAISDVQSVLKNFYFLNKEKCHLKVQAIK